MLFTSLKDLQFKMLVISRQKKNTNLIYKEAEKLPSEISLTSCVDLEKAEINFNRQEQDLLIIFADPLSENKLINFIKNITAKNRNNLLPILTIFSKINSNKKTRLIKAGVNTILYKPISREEFLAVLQDKLKYIFAFKELEHVEKVIYSFVETLEAKDEYTSGHSKRVARLSYEIGKILDLSETKLNKLYVGALIHDVGKVGVKDKIINKPGQLNDKEYLKIKQHPEIGVKVLKHLTSIGDIKKIIKHHHEWWDGSGYPDGLKGEEIPLESRIVAMADAIDAMLSNRPYRKGMTIEKVHNILKKNKNSQWENKIVDLVFENKLVIFGKRLNADIGSEIEFEFNYDNYALSQF